MVERMAGPEHISANALSADVGVPQSTLSRWLRLRGERRVERMDADKQRSARTWTAKEKLRVVMEANRLEDDEFGAFLRREGLHEAKLREWTETATTAATTALTSRPKGKGPRCSPEVKRIRELEKDLRWKEKALAEVAALLTLKKKLHVIWGDEDDSTSTRSGT